MSATAVEVSAALAVVADTTPTTATPPATTAAAPSTASRRPETRPPCRSCDFIVAQPPSGRRRTRVGTGGRRAAGDARRPRKAVSLGSGRYSGSTGVVNEGG